MDEMEQELAHLQLADRHLGEARARIAKQEELTTKAAGGAQSAAVLGLLANMQDALRHFEAHRVQILDRIQHLRGRPPPPSKQPWRKPDA